MTAILRKAWEGYNFIFDEIADPRTKPWFLVAKPYQVLVLLCIYLMLVLKWGPRYMKGRPAYNLDKLLIVYNFFQVISCIYIVYYGIVLAWGWDYKWVCEPVDTSFNQKPLDIAKTSYLYFIMKLVDLLDTVFFVLRKKHNQITFLHIYHHTGMVLLIWAAVTYYPGGHGTLIGVINSFVHIVMYSYYLYTVVNPGAKQSLWWKKYITQLQIVQFFWCVVHMSTIVFQPDCSYPRWTSAVFIPQDLFMLILFVDFYIKTYIRKPQAKKIKTSSDFEETSELNNSNTLSDGIENGVTNGNHELKTLALVLNELNKSTSDHIKNDIDDIRLLDDIRLTRNNGSRSVLNRSHSPQNGPYRLQNRALSLQSGSENVLNESYYSENRIKTCSNYINTVKEHRKSD